MKEDHEALRESSFGELDASKHEPIHDPMDASLPSDADEPQFRWHGGIAFPTGYTGPFNDKDNHLNISWSAREKDCIRVHATDRVALHDGMSCYDAATTETQCKSLYEQKHRGNHRRGYGKRGVSGGTGRQNSEDLWPDGYSLMGEVHLCEWRGDDPGRRCQAGKALFVCPEDGHIVEAMAAGNNYVGDGRHPYSVEDVGTTHEGNENFCENGFFHHVNPLVLDCEGSADSIALPRNMEPATLFKLGDLPLGTFNLWVNFTALGDLDMQLRDASDPVSTTCVAGYSCESGSGHVPGEGVTFLYKGMNIYFSGDEYSLSQREPHDAVNEKLHLDAGDPSKGSTVPLQMWVNAFSAVSSGTVAWSYNRIEPCPDEIERTLIEHNCQACSSYRGCAQGEYPVCDGSSDIKCQPL